MDQLKQIRDGDTKYDLLVPSRLPEFYVDGLSSAFAGATVSKLVFYSVSASPSDAQLNERVEAREATVQLTIPTASLVELAVTILKITTQNRENLEESFKLYRDSLDAAFLSIEQLAPKDETNVEST